ncbi:MAG: ABC transporter ATP-binding protein [Myxococcales bacterium]|nr:ABC transporter ATP-binding protein [Myxococcales bacterium]
MTDASPTTSLATVADAARFDRVTVRAGDAVLLDAVTARVASRGVTALLGPNGAGKSTLLSALLGLRPVTSGSISLFDGAFGPKSAPRGAVSAVLQDEGAFDGMTAHEYAALFGALFDDGALTAKILATSALGDRASRRLEHLSGGELRRLQLAAAVATEPALLVLDEPTNHLDPAARRALVASIRALGAKRAVLLATHDLHEAARVADAVIVLVEGRVRACGAVGALVEELPEAKRSRGLEGLFEHYAGATLDASGAMDEASRDALDAGDPRASA